MRKPISIAILATCIATPLCGQAPVDDCGFTRRISMLGSAYHALLQNPGGAKGREVALYVRALARITAETAPTDLREPLEDLGRLADQIYQSGGEIAVAQNLRDRHLQNARRLGNVEVPATCPAPVPPGHDAAEHDHPKPADEAAEGDRRDLAGNFGDARRRPLQNGAGFSIEGLGLIEQLEKILTRQTLLVGLGLATLIAMAVLLVVAVRQYALPAVPRPSARGNGVAALIKKLKRNRRRAPHHVLGRFFDVTDPATERSKRVKVADISLLGAKLNWPDPPAKGSRLHLNLDGIGRDSEVVWTNAHFCGVEFIDPLNDAELKMILIRPEAPAEASGELEMF